MENVKELMADKQYVEVIEIIEKELLNYANEEKDRAYFTLLNTYTRACFGQYETSGETVYFEKFEKVYLKMMDLQNVARAARFDISRYRKTYQKHYRNKP